MSKSSGRNDFFIEPEFTGRADYLDHHPEFAEPLPRIYLPFRLEGTTLDFLGLLDTGGHFCVLNRQIALILKENLGERVGERRLQTARGRLTGDLYQHRIELIADQGEHLAVEALLFLSEDWTGPNVLGYTGFVDRFRLAIEPRNNWIFFGPSGS